MSDIEIPENLRERFDRIKQECKDDHTPAPSDEMMLKSLMDEWEYETTPNEELRALVERWREEGESLELNSPDRVAEKGRGMIECAGELEELLND